MRSAKRELSRTQVLLDACRSFSSTLDLTRLMGSFFDRVIDLLDAEAGSLWMLEEESQLLECVVAKGGSKSSIIGLKLEKDKGIVGWVVTHKKPTVVLDAKKDDRFAGKIANSEFQTKSLICVPLICDNECLGAMQIINKNTSTGKFRNEDLKILTELAGFASISLKNARLYESQKKLRDLSSILDVSRKITSTLDLDSVLIHLTNMPDKVIPYERASVGLWHQDEFILTALTGEEVVDQSKHRDFLEILQIFSELEAVTYYPDRSQMSVETEVERQLKAHLEKTGMQGFYAMPLKDTEGRLGILSLESLKTSFLPPSLQELVEILGNQATVAIRNALLFDDVSMLELTGTASPLNYKWWIRHKTPVLITLLTFIALCLIPFDYKISGDAEITVFPKSKRVFHSEIEAVIKEIYFREGDHVNPGDLIARLEDETYQLKKIKLQSRRSLLLKDIEKFRGEGNNVEIIKKKIELAQLQKEIALNLENLQKTTLVSPIEGTLVTAQFGDQVGKLLKKGDEILKIVDLDPIYLVMKVHESEISRIQEALKQSLPPSIQFKLSAFPEESFEGKIERIGLIADENIEAEDAAYFPVYSRIDNPNGRFLPAMTGRSKVIVGRKPLGIQLLEKPVDWLYMKFW
jgi:GAF domain-containing protein/multidrug efflux pump subunit AcrA (membrane-fusion protein)